MPTLKNTDFYQSLGSERLGSLIREEHQTHQEIHGHKAAQNVQSLILERLPIFLHGNTGLILRVPLAELNNGRNFIIRTFSKVVVTRSINFAGARMSISFEASAVSMREGSYMIQLWLADNMEVDMYEVATSLCQLLFHTHKLNDAASLTTILSTDLHALQKRGYKGNYKLLFFWPH